MQWRYYMAYNNNPVGHSLNARGIEQQHAYRPTSMSGINVPPPQMNYNNPETQDINAKINKIATDFHKLDKKRRLLKSRLDKVDKKLGKTSYTDILTQIGQVIEKYLPEYEFQEVRSPTMSEPGVLFEFTKKGATLDDYKCYDYLRFYVYWNQDNNSFEVIECTAPNCEEWENRKNRKYTSMEYNVEFIIKKLIEQTKMRCEGDK